MIVDAGMFKEPVVLGGKERVTQRGRDLLVGQRQAPFLPELSDELGVARVDPQRDLQLHIAQRFRGG